MFRLALQGVEQEPFAACALALNLRTNVAGFPQPASQLSATCYPKFGLAGAKVALVAAPRDKLRGALQEAVTAAEELPHSPLGGPWALGQPINQGSYLFNFGGMTVEKADDWIKLAKTLGMTQIDFHGGGSFRFGDCRPNPQTYPEGHKSLKAVDRQTSRGGHRGRAAHLCLLHRQELPLGHAGARSASGLRRYVHAGRRPRDRRRSGARGRVDRRHLGDYRVFRAQQRHASHRR